MGAAEATAKATAKAMKAKRCQVIVYKLLAEISPYPQNPKAHTSTQVDRIAASIKEFGFCNPILIDVKNEIVAGHGRYKAAKKLKITDVPCVVLSHLTVKQRRAYRLADNRLSEKGGEWDNKALTEELQAILEENEISLETIGFTTIDIEEIKTSIDIPVFDPIQLDERQPEKNGDQKKVIKTETMDMEKPEKLKGFENAVIDFSGGKDSTLAAIWARTNFKKVVLRYVEISVEFPFYSDHVRRVAKDLDLELKIIIPEFSFVALMAEKGWPGWRWPWCHEKMLHLPLDKELKECYPPEDWVMITGGRSTQKKAGVEGEPYKPIARLKKYTIYQPNYYCTDKAVEKALIESGISIWDGYKKGFCRTACWCCPGQRPRGYAALKKWYPGLFRELLLLEKKYGRGWWSPKIKEIGLLAAVEQEEEKLNAHIAKDTFF